MYGRILKYMGHADIFVLFLAAVRQLLLARCAAPLVNDFHLKFTLKKPVLGKGRLSDLLFIRYWK